MQFCQYLQETAACFQIHHSFFDAPEFYLFIGQNKADYICVFPFKCDLRKYSFYTLDSHYRSLPRPVAETREQVVSRLLYELHVFMNFGLHDLEPAIEVSIVGWQAQPTNKQRRGE